LQNLPSLGFSERKNLSASFAVAQDTRDLHANPSIIFSFFARSLAFCHGQLHYGPWSLALNHTYQLEAIENAEF
jgi:hypothetical protein